MILDTPVELNLMKKPGRATHGQLDSSTARCTVTLHHVQPEAFQVFEFANTRPMPPSEIVSDPESSFLDDISVSDRHTWARTSHTGYDASYFSIYSDSRVVPVG